MKHLVFAALMAVAIAPLAAQEHHEGDKHAAPAAAPDKDKAAKRAELVEKLGGDYTLDVSPVRGTKLADVKEPFKTHHEGRALTFADKAEHEEFLKDPKKYLADLDKKMIAAQKAAYPLKACVVMPADDLDDEYGVNHMFGNRLVRFCCPDCVKAFEKNPGKYLAKVDAARSKGAAMDPKAPAPKKS